MRDVKDDERPKRARRRPAASSAMHCARRTAGHARAERACSQARLDCWHAARRAAAKVARASLFVVSASDSVRTCGTAFAPVAQRSHMWHSVRTCGPTPAKPPSSPKVRKSLHSNPAEGEAEEENTCKGASVDDASLEQYKTTRDPAPSYAPLNVGTRRVTRLVGKRHSRGNDACSKRLEWKNERHIERKNMMRESPFH